MANFEDILNSLLKPQNCKKDGHQFQLHVRGNAPTYVGCKRCLEKWYFK